MQKLTQVPRAPPQGIACGGRAVARRRGGDIEVLVNTADEILAKPGYGIAAERVTHRKPLVTIDRPGFRETGCFRDDLAKLGPRTALSLEDFVEGRLKGLRIARLSGPRFPSDPTSRWPTRSCRHSGGNKPLLIHHRPNWSPV